MSSNPLPGSFDELISTHDKPIIVDFWAEWCGPCKMVSPVVEQLAKEWSGRVTVIKVNTDEKPDIAARYHISGIPTIVMIKKGEEIHRVTGAMPFPRMKQEFEPYLDS